MNSLKNPRILSVSQPVKSNSSFGRWLVRFNRESAFGTRFHSDQAYFWRKADALAFCAANS